MTHDAMSRFSLRVEDYIRYRPAYPGAVVDAITACLGGPSPVADLGAGTGIFTGQLLKQGHTVYAVEPNNAMREAMERQFAGHPRCHATAGQAEATTLPNASVDAITAAQAFHWFGVEATRVECQRILRPGGHAFLIWNERLVEGSFLEAYEALLHHYAIDYAEVDHRQVAARINQFFGGEHATLHTFSHAQHFDWDGLAGRTRSCSYVPPEGHARHAPLMEGLRALYHAHAAQGRVTFRYTTQLYAGDIR
jgi:SAM-dependent methyltransferase